MLVTTCFVRMTASGCFARDADSQLVAMKEVLANRAASGLQQVLH